MASETHGDGSEKGGVLNLPSGLNVPFRVIQADDVPALQRFHDRLSETTIYLRFFGSLQELPEEKAHYFAHVDGVDHFAFIALDPNEEKEIIAVVRYDREPGSERAEYAALVEDRWQDHGVGLDLTRRLIEEARDKGIRVFYALVMGKNRRMLRLLRHLDLPEEERTEDGVKSVEVKLSSEDE
ncbi:MAG TPA: GNAT family N-acetyltransferase [Rubrobacteraceae bacterium]|nr:GNAT family N-acetyltransferase [Rubrobacteraceae bacterium]